MADKDSVKRTGKEDKKALLNTLSGTINPLIKQMQADETVLQMPELALRCAQFFHSISQYCLSYYHKYNQEEDLRKTKQIKKQDKDRKDKNSRGRGRKRGDQQEFSDHQSLLKLEPPKKPLTAYIIYFQDKKPNFVERYPSLNLSELTKLIAKQWKELSEAEKQIYLDRASEDRKRYEQQMAKFKRLYGKYTGRIPDTLKIDQNQDVGLEAIIENEGGVLIEEPQPIEQEILGEEQENEQIQELEKQQQQNRYQELQGESSQQAGEGNDEDQSENNSDQSESASVNPSNEKDS